VHQQPDHSSLIFPCDRWSSQANETSEFRSDAGSDRLGLGANTEGPEEDDDEFDQYRKRMMLAYRFRPNPLNNPRRQYY